MPDIPPPPAPGRRPAKPSTGAPPPPPAAPTVARPRAAETPTAPSGFVPQPGKEQTHIVPTTDVYVHFRPRNANRESSVLLFKRGLPVTHAEYQRSVDRYAEHGRLEFK